MLNVTLVQGGRTNIDVHVGFAEKTIVAVGYIIIIIIVILLSSRLIYVLTQQQQQ